MTKDNGVPPSAESEAYVVMFLVKRMERTDNAVDAMRQEMAVQHDVIGDLKRDVDTLTAKVLSQQEGFELVHSVIITQKTLKFFRVTIMTALAVIGLYWTVVDRIMGWLKPG